LSGETISSIFYSDIYELLVIGYENGLIEIAFDNDDKVLTFVDILDKPTIAPTIKELIILIVMGMWFMCLLIMASLFWI